MKTKKMGTYKKLVLILLAGAAIGGAAGAAAGRVQKSSDRVLRRARKICRTCWECFSMSCCR